MANVEKLSLNCFCLSVLVVNQKDRNLILHNLVYFEFDFQIATNSVTKTD
jgi:hypothetical protein